MEGDRKISEGGMSHEAILFGDSFYADPDRLSEKESGEGGKFLYHQG